MLSPYATKPSSIESNITTALGKASRTISAMMNDPSPEKIPFRMTISYVFLLESILVQLFSKPQQTHAPKTKSEPVENLKLDISSNDKSMLAMVMSPIANHTLFEISSLNMNKAMSDVAAISKLLSRDTLAAVAVLRPIIRNIGAAISSAIIPTVYGSSFFVSLSDFAPSFLCVNRYIIPMPIPAPKYRNDERNTEPILSSSSLDSGTLIAYSAAASNASSTASSFSFTSLF